jgi:chaperonin GroES
MANKQSTVEIKPLADYLLIEPTESETTTASGIVIPDTATKEKPQKGTVIAAGPGGKDKEGKVVPMEVKVGDLILYKKWGGTEVKLKDGKEYLLVKEEDILAIYA